MKKIFIMLIIFIITSLSFSCTSKDLFIEEKIVVKTNEYELKGILTIPNNNTNNFPAVVFIGGSGPTDMHSSVGKLRPFENMAQELAKKGIASIRYNKRTYEYQHELATNYYFNPDDEYVHDALSAINLLYDDDRIDHENIYLIGHSQGGQFAPVIANQTDKIKGIIIMAGVTAHILDILMEQLLNNKMLDLYVEYLPFYQTAKKITEEDESKYNWFYFGGYYNYWLEYNKIDFEKELINSAKNHSLLIMQGGKDLQVYEHHYERYEELLKDSSNYLVKYVFYPNLNHFFIDGRNETINNAYMKKGKVDQDVIDLISSAIKS